MHTLVVRSHIAINSQHDAIDDGGLHRLLYLPLALSLLCCQLFWSLEFGRLAILVRLINSLFCCESRVILLQGRVELLDESISVDLAQRVVSFGFHDLLHGIHDDLHSLQLHLVALRGVLHEHLLAGQAVQLDDRLELLHVLCYVYVALIHQQGGHQGHLYVIEPVQAPNLFRVLKYGQQRLRNLPLDEDRFVFVDKLDHILRLCI